MMKQLIYELLRGFAYRRIEHPEMRLYTTWLPIFISAVILTIYYILPARPLIIGQNGAATSAISILSTLPGFYFAGLAAVATFGNPEMDKEMPNPAPTLKIRVANSHVKTKLTRRLFLTYLFSYLVILSFMLCFSLLALNMTTESINIAQNFVLSLNYGEYIWEAFKFIIGSALVLTTSSLAVSTLHGVFFLTEKMHQP